MIASILEMVVVALIWGSVSIFSIWSGLPSTVFVFYRVAIAFPMVFVYALKRGARNVLRFTWFSAVSGVFLALNWIFFFEAISKVDVSVAVILYYFGPVFAVILSWFFLKEDMKIGTWIPVAMAVFGISLIFFNSRASVSSVSGVLFGLFAGLSYGALAVCGKAAGKQLPSEVLVAQQLLVSTILLVPFAFGDYRLTLKTVMIVATVGILHTGMALILWFSVLKRIPMRVASVLSYLDPVFATFLAWVILGQVPGSTTLVGGALIVVAGILVSAQYKGELQVKT